VAIWGESVGGSLAALTGTTCGVKELEGRGPNPEQSSCVQAVIDWYGATDMNQLDAQAPANAKIIHNSPDSNQSKVLGCVLHFECPASVVDRANPLAFVDPSDVNVSFLIMHGDSDTAVSYKQSQILYDALRSKGVPARFELVPGVNHNFAQATPEQGQHIMDVAYRFLAEALGGSAK
jgi:acetyl esterase/lipase